MRELKNKIMKKLKILKLGLMVEESASGIKGMLTHFQIDMSGNKNYQFQPSYLSPETHEPVEPIWVDPKRILGGTEVEVELPIEVLGTHVEDKATTFAGTAVALVHHINGCNHFAVKPRGIVEKTGNSIRVRDFDIRRLKGEKIPVLSDEEIQKSQKEAPSPADTHEFIPGKE